MTHLSSAKYTNIQMRAYGMRCIQKYLEETMNLEQPKLCKECVHYQCKAVNEPCDSCLRSGKAINWVLDKSIVSDTIKENQPQ